VTPLSSLLPEVAGSAVRRVFTAVAAVRRAPAVHPRGLAFIAELESVDPFPVGRYDAVVRLTKGLGLTDAHADVLGLAIRWWPTGEERPCDLLLSTAGTGRLTRWIPRPAQDWGSRQYTTLAPYERDGRRFWLRAAATQKVGHASVHGLSRHAPESFTLSTAGETGGWLTAGKLTLVAPGGDTGERFDPVLNRPPGWSLKPDWLTTVREFAYDGSRRGRRSVGSANQHQH
jgi:hypothetical protein